MLCNVTALWILTFTDVAFILADGVGSVVGYDRAVGSGDVHAAILIAQAHFPQQILSAKRRIFLYSLYGHCHSTKAWMVS